MQKFKMNKAIFFDRDGILIDAPVINGYPKSIKNISELQFCNGIYELCQLLKLKFILLMVTNQPDVARKNNSKNNVDAINIYIKKKLNLDDIFVCYCSDDKCKNRKPNSGMILNAQRKFNIDLKNSFFIGDRWRDIDTGYNSNVKSIFVNRGYKEKINRKPNFEVKNIVEIIDLFNNNLV